MSPSLSGTQRSTLILMIDTLTPFSPSQFHFLGEKENLTNLFIYIHYVQFTVQQGLDYKTRCMIIFQRFIARIDHFLSSKRKGREEMLKLEEEQREKEGRERYGGERAERGSSEAPSSKLHLQKCQVCYEFCFKIQM